MAGNMADLGAALNNTNAVAATLAAAATSALHNANGTSGVAAHDPSAAAARSAFSFRQWASDLGLARFADLIGEAGLADLIDTSMTPLTIFAPTDDAVARLGSQRPGEAEQLRELMCVHLVSTGQLCSTELLTWLAPTISASFGRRACCFGVSGRSSQHTREPEGSVLFLSSPSVLPAAYPRPMAPPVQAAMPIRRAAGDESSRRMEGQSGAPRYVRGRAAQVVTITARA